MLLLRPCVEALHVYLPETWKQGGVWGPCGTQSSPAAAARWLPGCWSRFQKPNTLRWPCVLCVILCSFQLQAVWHRAWSASSWYSYLTLLIFAHSWTAWETTAIWSYPVWKPPWDGQLTALSGLQWRHCVIWTAVEEDQRVKSKPELSHSGLRATEDGVAENMFFLLSKLPLDFPLSLFCFY